MIDREATKEKFGYWPEELSRKSGKLIVYVCSVCRKPAERVFHRYKPGVKCKDCWNNPTNRQNVTKEQLTLDIHRVIKQLGHQPTLDEYDEFGNHSSETVYKKFNKTWKEVLLELGYKVKRRSGDSYTYEQAATDLKLVKKKLGHIPGYMEYQKHGKITIKACKRAIKATTWAELVEKVFRLEPEQAIQYEVGKTNTKPIEHHFQRLRQIAKELGHTPTYTEASRYGLHKLKYRLKTTWPEVLKAAGLRIDKLPSITKAIYVTNKEIIKDILVVARKVGKCPTAGEYQKHGEYKLQLAQSRFGNWVKALEVAGFELKDRYERAKSIEKPLEYYFERLRDLARKIEKSPTLSQAKKEGIATHSLTRKLNTNWLGVLKAAGLDIENLPIETRKRYLDKSNKLTYRQEQVLALVAQGKTSKEVGRTLGITEHSVELHRMKIRERLGVRELSELINYAKNQGLISD